LILAAINPDNTPHGSNWTFAFPMVLFIVIAAVLVWLFTRPHRRVPPRRLSVPAAAHVPGAGVARSASVAGGLSVAPGGGTTESHLEPPGAHLTAAGHVDPVELEEPAPDAPVTDAPVTDAPVTDAPVTDAPVTDAPVTDEPAAGGHGLWQHRTEGAPGTDESRPPAEPDEAGTSAPEDDE
jgi:hypothetical protein